MEAYEMSDEVFGFIRDSLKSIDTRLESMAKDFNDLNKRVGRIEGKAVVVSGIVAVVASAITAWAMKILGE